MKLWVSEFEEEGPYPEDVLALCKYLGRVVTEERDLSKAVGVVKWLDFVVGELDGEEGRAATREWDEAVERVGEGVRGAARERGFAEVSFD